MSKLEEEAPALLPCKPCLYRRYIDDCILVWLHGVRKLVEFVSFMNNRHPDSVQSDVLQTELFVKPSHSGLNLSYMSSLPMDVKKSVAWEQFRRAYNNASTEQGRSRGEEKIAKLLQEKAYPQPEMQAVKRRASVPRQATIHSQTPIRQIA